MLSPRAMLDGLRRAARTRMGAAAIALAALALGGVGLRAVFAQGAFSINQPFTQSTASGWTLIGAASLTAQSGVDAAGSGWLRLTPATNGVSGGAWHSSAASPADGVSVAFDWAASGGGGADGFALVLFDGATTPTALGLHGFGLGAGGNCSVDGFAGSYLQIGFDAFGSYRGTSMGCPASGTTTLANTITVRGAGTARSGYPLIASMPMAAGISVASRPTSTADSTFRRAYVALVPGSPSWSLTVQVDVGNARTTVIDRQAVPAPVASALRLALTAGTGAQFQAHEVRNFVATPAAHIAGTVYEDVNYGGGAGRALASATGAAVRPGARVELLDASGTLLSWMTTDAQGAYRFVASAGTSYQVRVVNDSVTSSRSGATAALRAVQTFRTDATSGTAVAVTNRVGGEVPASVDAGNTATTLAALAATGVAVQSVTPVTAPVLGVDNVDFGFNFSTVVNTNDAGQGSLRQAIVNADTLGGDASLVQAGRTAGVENVVFMMADGTARAGLSATLASQFSGGVASIRPTTTLPALSAGLVLDAQTQPGFATRPVVEIDGSLTTGCTRNLEATAGAVVRGFVLNRCAGDGLWLSGASGAVAQGNWIGLSAAGTAAAANGQDGIALIGTGHVVGGTSATLRNVVSGNTRNGIDDRTTLGAVGNHVIVGNWVGLNAAGTAPIANAIGIAMDAQSGTRVGGSAAGEGNVVSGNASHGIDASGADVRVLGNVIGLNPGATAGLGNGGSGVVVSRAASTAGAVGGASAGEGNLIGGNTGNGVLVTAAAAGGASGLAIQGNRIGTDGAGSSAVGNSGYGIHLTGSATSILIGGTTADTRNLVSGNGDVGIQIDAGGVTVQGNYIGADATGNTAIRNGTAGIVINADSMTVIGGAAAGAGNVIAAHTTSAILANGSASRPSRILGNVIGLNAAGMAPLGTTTGSLIGLDGRPVDVQVGGSAAGEGNLIGGTAGRAIGVSGSNHTILGNRMGVRADGTTLAGSFSIAAVHVDADGAVHLGGTGAGEGNVITGSSGPGVLLSRDGGHPTMRISGNSIYGNGGLGIDIDGDGVTANDGLKTANTPNQLMDFPVITSARARGTQLTVAGYVGTTPGQTVFAGSRVELFVADPDATGYGEGRTYLGTLTTTTSGSFSGTLTMPVSRLALGTVLTATATDTGVLSSEFGPNFTALVIEQVVNHTGDAPDANPGDGVCETAVPNQCTLRAAIMEVNAFGGAGAGPITFALPTCPGADCTIAPATALPSVTRVGASIDAQTQAGWAQAPIVVLNGAGGAGGTGLAIAASGVTVRGLAINGWSATGLSVASGADGATIEGNWFGLAASGTAASANGTGLSVAAAGAQIGGTTAAQRNVFSGNTTQGLSLAGGATNAVVTGNWFGVSSSGDAGIANGYGLRSASGSGARIGGSANGEGNVFGASTLDAMSLTGTGGTVQANTIGLGADGTTPLAVGRNGIEVVAGAWTIGGTASGEGNAILGTAGNGVLVDDGARATILGNRIGGNALMGIDLGQSGAAGSGIGDGPGANDGVYTTARANAGMDSPVLVEAGTDGTTLTLSGYVGDAAGNVTFAGARIELFRADGDPQGGEGPIWLGTLTADAAGRFSGSVTLPPGALALGDPVSATATDVAGNTSEFSANRTVTTLSALRPAGLNAFETSTAAGALSGPIRTMVAGQPRTLSVVVLAAAGGGLHPSFDGTVSLEWMDARDNGGAVDAYGCRASWAAVGTAGTVSFTAGTARADVALTPPNAGREWRLRLSTPGADGVPVIACTTDAFAVRPDVLAITAVGDDTSSGPGTTRSLLAPDATGGVVHRAGRPFSVRAVARTAAGVVATGYDGTPTMPIAGCALPASGCAVGALSFAAIASNGALSTDAATYSEVGAFRASLLDDAFAAIDAADTPLADRRIVSAEVTVGRFVPDRLVLTQIVEPRLATQHGACAAPGAGFTFIGQAFGWQAVPALRVQAVNADGDATSNWGGALQRLAASHVSATLAAAGAPVALQSTWGTPTIADASLGRATVTLSGADRFVFARSATTPALGFVAQPTLSVSVADASEAAVAGNGTILATASLTMGGASGQVAFDAGATFHHGRLVVQHAFGDARRPIDAIVEVQRWTDRGWLRLSDAGTCVTVPANAWSYTAGTGALAGGLECRAAGSQSVTLRDGRGTLALPKIGDNRPAAMTVILNAGNGTEASGCAGTLPATAAPLSLPHLLTTRAGSTTLDQNPAARVVWGQPRQAWMARRELY